MCRAEFDKLFTPTVDLAIQKKIEAETGQEFIETKAELLKGGQIHANRKSITFSVGNTHSIVPNAKISRVGLPIEHRWTMFVLVNNSQ